MKKSYCIVFGLFLVLSEIKSQNRNSINDDTSRIVLLQEVSVKGIKKSSQDQLVGFFKSNNAASLEDILARLPEISLIRRGSYGMEPSVRYFNGGQINVQIDGMNIHGACTDKMDPATIYIEPINLDKIQVQTANSGFFNGSSIGGTLNMKIAEPQFSNPNQLTGSIYSGFQTAANSLYESLHLNYASNKWALSTSGTFRKQQNYRSGGGEVINYSGFEKANYSLSLKYQSSENGYYKIDFIGDDGWNIGYAALPMDVGYAAARIGSVSYQYFNVNKRLSKWSVKMYNNAVRHFMDDSKRTATIMHMDMPGLSKTFGAYSEGELNVNRKQKILFRIDGSSTFLSASMTMYQAGQPPMFMLTWPDNRRTQTGASLSWIYQLDSSLQFRLNSRADYIATRLSTQEAKNQVSIFDPSFQKRNDFLKNSSLLITKSIFRGLKVSAGLSFAERMPTSNELFGFYLFNASENYDYIGNPNLKTERSLQTDFSLKYSIKKSSVQLNYYHAFVQNYIVGVWNPNLSTMTMGANGVKKFENLAHASISGIELTGIFKLNNPIDIISTLRYTKAQDQNKQPLPYVSPIKNLNSIRYLLNQFSAQFETEAALSQKEVNLNYGEDPTDGYLLLHGRFGYSTHLFQNATEIQFGVENILDKKYHDHLDWGNIARPGRNFYVQLKISLH